MKDISNTNFGLLIAYVLPGFIAMIGVSGVWPLVAGCMTNFENCPAVPSIAGFLNMSVAAVAAGMVVSAVRFVVVDTIHHATGLSRPELDDKVLQKNLNALNAVVEYHYRYYQFHANSLVAVVLAYGAHLYVERTFIGFPEVLIALLAAVFWIGSRDNLRKYYRSLETIFDPPTKRVKRHDQRTPSPREGTGRQEKDSA